jgi:hypothetical protein
MDLSCLLLPRFILIYMITSPSSHIPPLSLFLSLSLSLSLLTLLVSLALSLGSTVPPLGLSLSLSLPLSLSLSISLVLSVLVETHFYNTGTKTLQTRDIFISSARDMFHLAPPHAAPLTGHHVCLDTFS